MQKLYSYDITFEEIPGQVSLVLAFSGCTNKCEGCHTPWLHEDVGEEYKIKKLDELLKKYSNSVNCVVLLGGEDHCNDEFVKLCNSYNLDTGLYTGRKEFKAPNGLRYLKTGPYTPSKGPLSSAETNQVMMDLKTGKNLNYLFQKEG